MLETLPNWQSHDVTSLRAFARVRLIALDVDATLLKGADTHLSETIHRLQKFSISLRLKERVNVTLATGRTFAGIKPLLPQLFLPGGVPLILYNGSVVINSATQATLMIRRIPRAILHRLLSLCADTGIGVLAYFYSDPGESSFSTILEPERVLGWSNTQHSKVEFNRMPVLWQPTWEWDGTEEPTAILLDGMFDAATLAAIQPDLAGLPEITTTRSGSRYVEIRPFNSNKGEALRVVAETLGLPREAVLALGDNDNDMEMLGWAGIGVCVADASPGAKSKSEYVCRYGAAEGAVELLRLVKQARRYFVRESLQHKEAGDG